MNNVSDHVWMYLRQMCVRERVRLIEIGDVPGNMLPLMSAWDSLNEIEYMIPYDFWPTHERFSEWNNQQSE